MERKPLTIKLTILAAIACNAIAAPIFNTTCAVPGSSIIGAATCSLQSIDRLEIATASTAGDLFGMSSLAFTSGGSIETKASATISDADAVTFAGVGLATLRLTVMTNTGGKELGGLGSIAVNGFQQFLHFNRPTDPDPNLIMNLDYLIPLGQSVSLDAALLAEAFVTSMTGLDVGLTYQLQQIRLYAGNGDQLAMAATTEQGRAFNSVFQPGDDSRGPVIPGDPGGVPEPSTLALAASGVVLYTIRRSRRIERIVSSLRTSPRRSCSR